MKALRWRRAIVLATAASLLTSCQTPSRLLDRLDDPEPRKVVIACGEEYNVVERSAPRRIIVASTLAQEYERKSCSGYDNLNRLERFRKVALQYLAESGRKGCTTSNEQVVAAAEVSAQYRCDGDPEPADPPKPGRGKDKRARAP